jgi:acetylornithine deacetylase/succinyl-diaminopimelate desuccinylase
MFNGHIDTVPPGEMVAPFEARIEEGRMHGRGTCDMKGGVACQVYAMLCLKRAGVALDDDVLFTGVIAEEDGTSLGAVHVAAHGPKADMVLVAEPTALETVTAHKGFDYYAVEVRGRAAHSSRPENGVNAIYKSAKVLRAIEERLLPATRARQHPLLGPASINVSGILGAARTEENLIRGQSDIEKHPGGTVADFCTVYMDRRRIPGERLEEVFAEMRVVVAELATEDPDLDAELVFLPACDVLESHPPLDTAPDHPLVRACLACNEAVAGIAPVVKGVPFWSDAAVFHDRLGLPAIVYGPGFIDVAHSVREEVPVDHLAKASRVMGLLAASVTRSG